MVPKIHRKGKSFKGAARYLVGKVGEPSRERVAWTETVNLAVRNPESAWRVMAATALDQQRLKQQAGVPNTGRKSADHVLHFTLSWHPDEAPKLNRDEMLRATRTILHIMGAGEHQALVVCHQDRQQPHVHVLVNRVNPHDGRFLSSSYEKLKASRWAQKYEEQRGQVFCEERVINNAARQRGEYTRGKKDQTRHIHDLAPPSRKAEPRRQRIVDEHRRQAAALKAAERAQQTRHREAWDSVQSRHMKLIEVIRSKSQATIAKNITHIRSHYRPLWEHLHHEQQVAWREFERREAAALGRLKNTLKALDLKRSGRAKPSGGAERSPKLTDAFRLLSDGAARRQAVQRQQEQAKRALAFQQRCEEAAATKLRTAERQRYLAEAGQRYLDERSSLILTQSMEQAKLKLLWREKGQRLRTQVRELKAQERNVIPLTQQFTTAARAEEVQRSQDSRSAKPPEAPACTACKPSELLPKAGADQAAKQVDQWQALIDKRLGKDRDLQQDRGDDRDR